MHNACTTSGQISDFSAKLHWVSTASWKDLSNTTGCPIKCTILQYQLFQCRKKDITWKHDWSSSFFLTAERTMVRKEEEYLVFDEADTINGIGGALGLFLGWSILYLVTQCLSVFNGFIQFIGDKITNRAKSSIKKFAK